MKQLKRAFEVLPLALPAALAAFGCVAVALLLIGQLHNWLVWPLGLLAAAATIFIVVRTPQKTRPGSLREQYLGDFAVVLAVAAWAVFNMVYASQHLFTNRDPGTYANASAWLVHHSDLHIFAPPVFGDIEGIKAQSPGFDSIDKTSTTLHAQGQHLLPVLVGLGGRIVGDNLMLRLSPLFGAAALLALYGFARLLVKPRWAVLATAVAGVSLPMLYFSRDTYTEPLAMTFVFGGLALLWVAWQSQRQSLWLLAGLVAGAGALVRVDSYLTLAGFLLFLILFLLVQNPDKRRRALRLGGLFVAGIVVTATLGLLDVALLSSYYFNHHKTLVYQELVMVAVIAVIGVIAVTVSWRTKLLSRFTSATARWWAPAAALLVLAGSLVMVSRPLWFTAESPTLIENITTLQTREGDPASARLYEEQTVNWVSWYIGPLVATLGVIGLAIIAAKATRRENVFLAAGVLVVAVTAVVYLIKPSVFPDQIWASRRFLPVVIPGLVVFGMIALERLSDTFLANHAFRRTYTTLIVATVLLAPILVSRPFLTVRDTAQLPIVKGLCEKLPDKAAVLWLGDGQYYTVQPTRSFCNVPSLSYESRKVSGEDLAKAATNAMSAGYTPVVAVLSGDVPIIKDKAPKLTHVSDYSYQEMEMRLEGPPRNVATKRVGVFAGILQPDGSIAPLTK